MGSRGIGISPYFPAMQKLISLIAGIAILLVGCQPVQNSRTWEAVKAAPHIGPGIPNRTTVYSQQLHRTLQRAGVHHKVVTFRFKYPSLQKIDRVGEDVAVIYKDTSTPDHPWWLMAEYLWNPVWLTSSEVQRQVDFYVRRPAKIVSVTEFRGGSGGHDGKSVSKPQRKPVLQRMENADRRSHHSAKCGKRGSVPAPKAPQGPPVPQVNPPTVRSRFEVVLRPA